MRVLSSKYGFLVTIILLWLVFVNSNKSNDKSCEAIDKVKRNEENSKLLDFVYSVAKSNNYIKYFYDTSSNFIPIPGNPAIVKKPERTFLSPGQTFLSCGSSSLMHFDIKDDSEKILTSANISIDFGSKDTPADLENVLKGLAVGDSKVFLSNMQDYPKSLTNYKGYSSKHQYLISTDTINIINGVVNKAPFYFTVKTAKKTIIPSCLNNVVVEYKFSDLMTSAIIIKESVKISYDALSRISLSYPLLAIGINNDTEVVASKQTILLAMLGHPSFKLFEEKLEKYKDTDTFVLQQTIKEIVNWYQPWLKNL